MPVVEELREEAPLLIPQEYAKKAESAWAKLIKSWIQTALTTTVVFFFTITFIVQGFCVYGSCMEPNLWTGERLLGNKLVYWLEQPTRGDIIVFRYPHNPKKTFIKRVVGLPGETIEIEGGRVYINGRRLSEPYLVHTPHGSYGPEMVKRGNLFVMGDFRDQSNDSRYWGELPISNVEAKAWLRYWPLGRMDVVK